MTERASDRDNSAFYERDSASYDASRFADHVGERETQRLDELLQRRRPASVVPHILEVGCGTGRATRMLAASTPSLSIVDVSGAMLLRASEVAKAANPDLALTATEASIFDLPFESDRFEMAASINVLTHLRDFPAAIRELARVITPGGRLIFSTTSLDSLYFPAGLYVNRRGSAVGQNVYSIWPTRRKVRRAIDDAGLRLIATDAMFHVPRAVRRIPLAGRALAAADGLARSTRGAARLAPWVLWTAEKPAS